MSSGQCVTKPYFYMPHGPVYMLTFDCSTTIYYYYYKPQISGGKTTFHSTAGWRGHAPGVENGPFISCVCCCHLPYFFHAVFTRHETFLSFLKRPICETNCKINFAIVTILHRQLNYFCITSEQSVMLFFRK